MRRPVLLLFGLLAACSDGGSADPTCTVDRDCASGSCVGGRCLEPKDGGARQDAAQGRDARAQSGDGAIGEEDARAEGDTGMRQDATPMPSSCGALGERETEAMRAVNDTPENAEALPMSGTVAGELQTGMDIDWFSVEVPEGGMRLRAGVEVRGGMMDAELVVTDGDAYERVGTDPTSLDVTRELFIPEAGTYYVGVHDARAGGGAAPEVRPGTFCYSLAVTALPAPTPASIALPAAGMTTSATFTVGPRGELGYFRVATTPANLYRPFVINLSAPPEGPGLAPDVDTILTVWDPLLGEVHAESDDAGNTNSNLALAFSSTVAGRPYWLIVDHYALSDEDEDGLDSAVTLEIDEPASIPPALPFTETTRRLTERRSIQWYLSSVLPGRRISVDANGAAGGLSDLVVLASDVDGSDLGASAGGTSTAALSQVSLQSDRTLFAVVSLDDLTMPAATGAYTITFSSTTACPAPPMTVMPASANLAINEILWDPAADPDGDANGDGESNTQDDEFVELINTSSDAIDLGGVSLADISGATNGVRFAFPCGTVLRRGQRAVVFGGGELLGNFGTAEVFTSNVTLSCAAGKPPRALCLNNAREEGVVVRSARGAELTRLAFSSIPGVSTGPNASYVRCTSRMPAGPEECDRGNVYVQHDEVPGVADAFSPGTPTAGAPPIPGDTCAMPDEIAMSGVLTAQSTAGLTDDYAPDMTCLAFEPAGPDRVYRIAVPAGMRLTVTVTPMAPMDAALYLLPAPASACEAVPLGCLAGADTGEEGAAETATWQNTGATPAQVFVVVDDFELGGTYTLETRLGP